MNHIQILDCTLRDGGYCNQWRFGFENIKKITKGLVQANIDIIECGFLTNRVQADSDITKFTSITDIASIIPFDRQDKRFVAMINYGEYDINELPVYDGTAIDGIRFAFHKKNRVDALKLCEKIKEKGYSVYVQAMVSTSYTDEEFLDLIHRVNQIRPLAFYIVDSFGMMKEKDLTRLFYMVEHNLDASIWIGFHSHNNLQLAYANAQKLTTVQTNRNIIIDSSIHGMGRGAGNLNTELFIDYLNNNADKNYRLKPILILIDEIINSFYLQKAWGYSLPNYISAVHNAHPNYASYLDDKKTLTIEDMNEIFGMMDDEKKVTFEKDYIESIYLHYMNCCKTIVNNSTELSSSLAHKTIILVAPGRSSIGEASKIQSFKNETNAILISINHVYSEIEPDYVFLSNLRRYREFDIRMKSKCIVTSNIPASGVLYQAKYSELLNFEEAVSDNAGLMAIKFLITQNVASIYLAGFDGYSHNSEENYGNSTMTYVSSNDMLDAINIGMSKMIQTFRNNTVIEFLTTPRFVKG